MNHHLYSIIIPIYNEAKAIPELLIKLKPFSNQGHEIIIVDDGSTDESSEIISNCNFVESIHCKTNRGKGAALKKGLKKIINDKVIIFDGDLEINPIEISKLMVLDQNKRIYFAMGYRLKDGNPVGYPFKWGNFIFTTFFNILFLSNSKDILCCAKSFYLNNIDKFKLVSDRFDIDAELASILTIKNRNNRIPQIPLTYNRRTTSQGKKLKISDGWTILSRIIKMIKYL